MTEGNIEEGKATQKYGRESSGIGGSIRTGSQIGLSGLETGDKMLDHSRYTSLHSQNPNHIKIELRKQPFSFEKLMLSSEYFHESSV